MKIRLWMTSFGLIGASFLTTFIWNSCVEVNSSEQVLTDSVASTFSIISPIAQTTIVANGDDAADDPCIWIHPLDKSKSLIIGTNKKNGLDVYDLNGDLLHSISVGRLNNVDVRYGFVLGKDTVDLVVATNRSYNGLSIFKVDPKNQTLIDLGNEDFKSEVGEVYGFALGQPKMGSELYAVLVSKTGEMEQWRLNGSEGKITGEIVRNYQFSSICEGIVIDDFTGFIYVGQEEQGIWKLPVDPKSKEEPVRIVSLSDSPNFTADLEGLSLYYASETEGYLIASIQGNNSYAIFERQVPHAYLGSFIVSASSSIDGSEETDGLDVENRALPGYPNGILVVQDGHNHVNGKEVNQNFKIIDWKEIADSFTPKLKVNPQFER